MVEAYNEKDQELEHDIDHGRHFEFGQIAIVPTCARMHVAPFWKYVVFGEYTLTGVAVLVETLRLFCCLLSERVLHIIENKGGLCGN